MAVAEDRLGREITAPLRWGDRVMFKAWFRPRTERGPRQRRSVLRPVKVTRSPMPAACPGVPMRFSETETLEGLAASIRSDASISNAEGRMLRSGSKMKRSLLHRVLHRCRESPYERVRNNLRFGRLMQSTRTPQRPGDHPAGGKRLQDLCSNCLQVNP